ncbi:MAG: membrane protein insertion efficiency factor YidD [bacterium]
MVAKSLRYLLSLYQKLNIFPSRCRFYPSCSHYADEAIAKHGAALGLYLSFRRLIKCGKWNPGGFDPVP